MRHYDVRIYGRVHGVNFRWSTKQKAKGLQLYGFVRNEGDGSIYIEVEGQEEELEDFLGWCHRGPFFARVDRIEFDENVIRGYNRFEIKFT